MKVAALLCLLALACAEKVYDLDALLAFSSSSEENASGQCPSELFNRQSVELVNNLMDEMNVMASELRQRGMDMLNERFLRIRAAFQEGGCENLLSETMTAEYRDEPLYKFLEAFKTPSGNLLTPEMINMIKNVEQMIWYAVRNTEFTSCLSTKMRNTFLGMIDQCMGDKINLATDRMNPVELPEMREENEFMKNVRGMINMFVKAGLLAPKCEDPVSVVKQMREDKQTKFCRAARKSYGSEEECFATFERRCPSAMKCMRRMFSRSGLKEMRRKIMGAIKDVSMCRPSSDNQLKSMPSVKNIMKRMFKVMGATKDAFRRLEESTDENTMVVREEALAYLKEMASALMNENSCDCKEN
jgi:hypothetical protein